MMRVDVARLPMELTENHLRDRAVVIFDVLRATTTMVSAISAGAKEVRAYDSLDAARDAAGKFRGEKLLCGERQCLAPEGFDLGNSPGAFVSSRVTQKTIFMSTTNGTRAIVAAAGAARRFAAALVNRSATAKALSECGLDVTLLCAGTNGAVAPEDLIGAGAVIESLREIGAVSLGDSTNEASRLFHDGKSKLSEVLRSTAGGQNVVNAGLDEDILYAARLDMFDFAVEIIGDPPVARRMIESCPPTQDHAL